MSQHCTFCDKRLRWAVPCLNLDEAAGCLGKPRDVIPGISEVGRLILGTRPAPQEPQRAAHSWDDWKPIREIGS